jgi:hypothetical protein
MVYPAETVFSAPYVTHITVRVEHPRPVSLVCAAVKPLTPFVLYALPARAGHPQVSIFTPAVDFYRSAVVSPRSAQEHCGRFRPHRCRSVRLAQ